MISLLLPTKRAVYYRRCSRTTHNNSKALLVFGVLSFCLVVVLQFGAFHRYDPSWHLMMDPKPSALLLPKLIVVAPTYYASLDDPRFALGLQCCREAARHGIHLLLVDASPNPTVRQQLRAAGSCTVYEQQVRGKKGAALREAIQHAYRELLQDQPSLKKDDVASLQQQHDLANAIIAFQEPEKVDMMRHWSDVVKHMQETQSDICVPQRSDTSFRATYPVEQYHAEQFANLHLNAQATRAGWFPDFSPALDWTFGPVAFRAGWAPQWLDYDGELWDAQLVPLIRARKRQQAKVTGYEIDFHHPATMKAQEEGVPQWSHKRLFQLNLLFDKVGGEFTVATGGAASVSPLQSE